jgi:hypothetical protein
VGYAGCGGGAGAYIEVILSGSFLLRTFKYSVGSGGSAGTAGAGGYAGGAGGSGVIIIEEYYN